MPSRTDPTLANLVKKLRDAKNAKKLDEETIREVTDELLDVMHNLQKSAVTVTSSGVAITANAVHSSVVEVDEVKLRKELGAKAFDALTKRVLDKDLLEDAIARGVVDGTVVAQCSQQIQRKPYITIKERSKVLTKRADKAPPPARRSGSARGGRAKSAAAKAIER